MNKNVFALVSAAVIAICSTVSSNVSAETNYAVVSTVPGVVQSFEDNTHNLQFVKDEVAIVRVLGDGSGDFDCRVLDSHGNVVDKDVSLTDTCFMVWKSTALETFRVVVRNRTSRVNHYNLSVLRPM